MVIGQMVTGGNNSTGRITSNGKRHGRILETYYGKATRIFVFPGRVNSRIKINSLSAVFDDLTTYN